VTPRRRDSGGLVAADEEWAAALEATLLAA
jgi:hypothetical protein